MDLLILGGTRFSGREAAATALAAGHQVTLLHRGTTGADLFRETAAAEHVLVDRDGGMGALAGPDGRTRRFDAVFDFCGYAPRVVAQSVDALRDSGRYLFVSTISVYADPLPDGATEDAPVHAEPDDPDAALTDKTYGPLKVACERVVRGGFGDRATIVRPGFVIGPNDPTDRLPSLVRRAAAGGDMLAYGPPDGWLQAVDARDLGAFLVHLAEQDVGGTLHAVHPRHTVTVRDVLEAARAAAGADTLIEWADPAWLAEALGEAAREAAFPLWDPDPASRWHALDGRRAAAAGLRATPIARTVADVLAWDRARGPDAARPNGLDPDRERELIAAWRAVRRVR